MSKPTEISGAAPSESRTEHGFTRRAVVQSGALLTTLLSLKSLPAAAFLRPNSGSLDTARFLASYLSHGFTKADYDSIQQVGYQAFLDQQLASTLLPDPLWDSLNTTVVTDMDGTERGFLELTPKELFDQLSPGMGLGFDGLANIMRIAQVVRSITTTNQALDKWSEYLTQHHIGTFGSDIDNAQPLFFGPYIQSLRTFEGTITTALQTMAREASMLRYLNVDTNVKTAPNENFARELVELYTMSDFDFDTLFPGGVPEYEAAVKVIARIFTGWNFEKNPADDELGDFQFVANDHDNRSKRLPFLGVIYSSSSGITGEAEGTDLLNRLGTHPSTAQNWADRLCRWFLADAPPQALIDHVADRFLASSGRIRTLLEELFDESLLPLWRPQDHPLFLRSSEWFYWTIRTLGIQPDGSSYNWVSTLITLGNAPGDNRAPNGYQPGFAAGQDSIFERWGHAFAVTRKPSDGVPGLPFPDSRVADVFGGLVGSVAGEPGTPPVVAQKASDELTGGLLSTAELQLIQAYYDEARSAGLPSLDALRDVLALTLIAPRAQFLCG